MPPTAILPGIRIQQLEGDWLSRINVPDLYPRTYDPYRPSPTVIPGAGADQYAPPAPAEPNVYDVLTLPAPRPFVLQRAVNFQVSVGLTAIPLQNQQTFCDTIIFDVASTAANSIFFGFTSSVTTVSGIEVRPGLPIAISPDNTRELWELQRSLEIIATLMARQAGLPDPGMYRAPRVVFDASDWFVIAPVAGPTNLAVMTFYVPEMQ